MMVQTEIGLLPEDWEVVQIGDIFSMPSNSIRTQYINPNEYVSTENLLPNKAGVSKYTSRIDYAFIREYKAGDSLMSNIRPYLKKIWFSDRNGGCSSDVIVFRPSKDVDSRYAYFVLSDDRIFRLAMETSIGTKMPRGDKNAIVAFPIALPKDKSEQQNIASALSSIDKLIDDLGRTIQKKQRIREGAMEELLSGKKRLPGFTEEWVEKKIGEVFPYIKNGASYDIKNTSGYPMTRIETISKGVINHKMVGFASEEPVKYKMQTGDILFSHINSVPYIGRVAYYYGDRPLYHGMNVLLLRTKAGYDTLFLFYLLASKKMKKYFESIAKQAINQASINTKELSEVMIYIPSDIQEQHVIADILTSMDDEISLLESERAKYEQIRSGMMEELLTGKKRLK